jgi:RNA-directed DNA polymerase
MMISPTLLARNLAAVFLAGDWTLRAMARRARGFLGPAVAREALRVLIADVLGPSPASYPPSPQRLQRIIRHSAVFERIHRAVRMRAAVADPVLASARFTPLAAFAGRGVPPLATPGELAHWFDLSIPELEWFADTRRRHAVASAPALQHYAYVWRRKRAGPPRLIEAPKSRLKAMQRRILADILDRLPAHDCAHGFVKGRSVRTAAHLHAGESMVITIDLKDFFLNASLRRVHGIFRSLGFPWAVARLLTGLCSTTTPRAVFAAFDGRPRPDWITQRRYRSPHLPQGAPTSPALANFCAFRLDCRLRGLAARLGARYTRYADDLAFSGDEAFARRHRTFLAAVARIVADEGFAVNGRKTRVMRRSTRQRITGLVVNQHVNVARDAYDRLKATLHNCLRDGPGEQNRDRHRDFRAHLDGRISWVESVNPPRGLRLRAMFEGIAWPE